VIFPHLLVCGGAIIPCGPDVWQFLKSGLPSLAVYASVAAYAALVALLLWAPRVRKRSAILACRIAAAVLTLPLAVATPVIGFGLLLASGDPPAQTRTAISPRGNEATLRYQAGFLGRDYTEVLLKSRNGCRHVRVLSHAGPSWFDDPKIEWIDDHHLHLTYHARRDDPQRCERQVDDVVVNCSASPWPASNDEPGASSTTSQDSSSPAH